MKKIKLLIILLLILSCKVYAQTIIENPKYGYSNAFIVNIKKIELTDTSTNMYCHVIFRPGNWINIPDKTYIQPVDGGEKLYIKGIDGIPLNKRYTMPKSGEVSYKLIFPKIGNQVKRVDYGESDENGWLIYDIQVRPETHASLIPQELSGNWFNRENGSWALSIFDSVAVYKNQVWYYDAVKLKKGAGSLILKNKTKTIELFIKNDKNGIYSFGESPNSLSICGKDISKLVVSNPITDRPYEAPVFKMDSTTYSGYIKHYSPRFGFKTMNVIIDDIITGEQNSFLIQISANGYFTIKLPLYYPHYAYVRSSLFNGAVFLEPSKELFHLIGQPDNNDGSLFMGESAKINTDLLKLDHISSYDYNEVNKLILNMTPAQYKAYCLEMRQKDFKILDSITKAGNIGAKAYQIKRLDLDYRNMVNATGYNRRFDDAYRAKNKIPREQRALPVKPDSLTGEYYNFITNENANNPLAVLSSSYKSYINQVKYLPIIRGNIKRYTTSDIADELQKSGYVLTEGEQKVIEVVKLQDSHEVKKAQKEFNEKYGKVRDEFNKKYRDTLMTMYKQGNKIETGSSAIEEYFNEKNIKLSKNDKLYLRGLKKLESQPALIDLRKNYKIYGDSISQFHTRHKTFINDLFANSVRANRIEKMQTILGIQEGLITDIMTAEDICRKIVSEMNPASDAEIKVAQKQLLTPFIADYIGLCNEQMKAKIEANKKNTGYVVNEVPKTDADNVFDGIMQKYRGKVVYVDFWATWCGPCRSGIQRIKPLKEEMENEKVAFVYITNQSSPEHTWSNMIPDIKGEHYRVSTDEWNYLSSKFNISGIPHYVLVGKQGEVINPELGHMDNGSLKKELEKYINDSFTMSFAGNTSTINPPSKLDLNNLPTPTLFVLDNVEIKDKKFADLNLNMDNMQSFKVIQNKEELKKMKYDVYNCVVILTSKKQ